MRKYLTAYSISLQQTLQRRSTLFMDRLGGICVILSLYYFWTAMLGDKPSFLGYSRAQMLSYVLAMNILRSFVFTGRGWELVQEISSGRISSYLVRPLSYHGYALSLDLAQKTVHVAASFLEVGVLILLVGAPVYAPAHWQSWLLFPLAVAVSSLLFFFLEFIVSTLAFWTSESGGPLFCFELFLQFAAGTFFPLDVLPRAAQKALAFTPFPYLVFFPLNIYLERPVANGGSRALLVEIAWLALAVFLALRLWRRGLDSYAAEGG